jgi:hypothetical protein
LSAETPSAHTLPRGAAFDAGAAVALRRRWRAAGRGARAAVVALGLLLAGAIAVRVWLIAAYGPAFLGFGDSHEYVTAAARGVFGDVQKPAGYPIFLALLHALSARLTFTIVVQHCLGLATGLLLFAAVQRTGAPAWLGAFPAAVAFFGGTGLLLEHALLADPLFAFLQAAGVFATVCALSRPGLRWPLLAGLAVGLSFWVKTVALSSAVLVPCVLFAGMPGPGRPRLRAAAVAAGAALALVLAYAPVQAAATGRWGYERQSAWNLYGRVATFVDCTSFRPPSGTRFLCPPEAPSRRQGENYYQYARSAPAVVRYGGPARAPAAADETLQRFSVAAIEHEPLAYAGAILRSLTFYVSPRAGEGYTPSQIREALFARRGVRAVDPAIAAYYPRDHGYLGPAAALTAYDRLTRVQGWLLVAMLLAALAAAVLLRGRQRAAAALFALTALGSVTLAAAGNGYDARYGYPALGPLAAAAALGAWAIARHVQQRRAAAADATNRVR